MIFYQSRRREDLSVDELVTLEKYNKQLVMMSKKDKNMHQSHSIEEAGELHELKATNRRKILEEM